MKVIALNFSAPLQSWAGKAVHKTRVNTQSQPSERAIRGLIAAAYGIPRVPHGQDYPEPISGLEINPPMCIRPGHAQRDYQTIGNRSDEIEYLDRIRSVSAPGRSSKNPALTADANQGTSVIERTYLGGAWFLVLLKGRNDRETLEVLDQLLSPTYSPYLGKKAFPPTFPFVLGPFDEDGAVKEAEAEIVKVKDLIRG